MSISPSDASAVAPVSATYFDGRSAIAHAVTLVLNEGVLRVSGHSITRNAPIAELRVSEAMGAAPRLISFPDGAHCEVRDHAGMSHMLKATGFEDSLVVRLQQRWRWAMTAIGITLAVFFAGYHWGLPAISEWLAFRMPDTVLARMGGSTLSLLDRMAFVPSKLPQSRQQALSDAFARLAAPGGATSGNTRYTLHFRHGGAVGSNAMALPDGTIVVTDQLVNLAAHDEEILAVLTHELGHIRQRHGLRMLIQGSIVAFVVSFYLGDVSSVAAGLPTLLLQARYSRDHEREADQFGSAMLKANGMSPARLADMLGRLEESHRGKGRQLSGKEDAFSAGDYLQSHPATRERVDALKNTGP